MMTEEVRRVTAENLAEALWHMMLVNGCSAGFTSLYEIRGQKEFPSAKFAQVLEDAEARKQLATDGKGKYFIPNAPDKPIEGETIIRSLKSVLLAVVNRHQDKKLLHLLNIVIQLRTSIPDETEGSETEGLKYEMSPRQWPGIVFKYYSELRKSESNSHTQNFPGKFRAFLERETRKNDYSEFQVSAVDLEGLNDLTQRSRKGTQELLCEGQTSSPSRKVIESFLDELDELEYRADIGNDYGESATNYKKLLRRSGFRHCLSLVRSSLTNTEKPASQMYFLDNSFNESKASLHNDTIYRRDLAYMMHRYSQDSRNKNFFYCRIITLDSAYEPLGDPSLQRLFAKDVAEQLLFGFHVGIAFRHELSDIVSDLAIGDKILATLNGIVSNQGLLVRASQDHSKWCLGAVEFNHRQVSSTIRVYQDLYRLCERQGRVLTPRDITKNKKWTTVAGAKSLELDKRRKVAESLTLDKLRKMEAFKGLFY